MKSQVNSIKSNILFCVFCLIAFGTAAYFLFVIDALLSGWISLVVLLAAFIYFRFSRFWEKILKGNLKWFKKLWIYILVVLALGANNRLSKPDKNVSYKGTLIREMIREVRNMPVMAGDGMLSAGANLSSKGSNWQPPKGYTYEKINCGVPIELLRDTKSTSNKLVFQIHGGAYVIGMIDSYRNLAVKYSKLTNGASVLNVDYRIAPEYEYPAALEDGLMAWDWIIKNGWNPKDVIIVGDSAGGNLTLALCHLLKDQGRELPGKIICMSPWADLTAKGPSHVENLYKDPMFGIAIHSAKEINKPKAPKAISNSDSDSKPLTSLYAGNADLYDKYVSPVYGDFAGFPKMLIQVGTWEVLQSDSQIIYEKAKSAGTDVILQEYEGMYHVFQQLQILPESKKAWKEIEKFCKD